MKKLLSLAAMVMLGVMVTAEEPKNKTARIDLNSKTVKLTPKANCKRASWMKDEDKKSKFLTSSSKKLSDEQWIDYEIEFIPESDGEVILFLRGMYFRPKGADVPQAVWIYFDDIEVVGTDLLNGGFEEVDDKGKLKPWFSSKENIVTSDEIAKSGKRCIKVWHNKSVHQRLKVKKGKTVKIKAKVKAVRKLDK
jgi:hypothetical protein